MSGPGSGGRWPTAGAVMVCDDDMTRCCQGPRAGRTMKLGGEVQPCEEQVTCRDVFEKASLAPGARRIPREILAPRAWTVARSGKAPLPQACGLWHLATPRIAASRRLPALCSPCTGLSPRRFVSSPPGLPGVLLRPVSPLAEPSACRTNPSSPPAVPLSVSAGFFFLVCPALPPADPLANPC